MSDYVGEKVDYVDNFDKDLMNLIELDQMLFQLGYKDCMGYYYAKTNGELVWCLTDENVLEMCSSLSKDREVGVFVKHREVLHIPQSEIVSSNVCN